MKKIKGKKLAEGEMTGHAHILDNSKVFELDNGLRIFDGNKQNTLTHQEHKSIIIPSKKGRYVSDKVLEYDHFAEEARKVKD